MKTTALINESDLKIPKREMLTHADWPHFLAYAATVTRSLIVHTALQDLSRLDELRGRVVKMRYFGGLDRVKTAEALGLSAHIVRRDWDQARLLLAYALKVDPADAASLTS